MEVKTKTNQPVPRWVGLSAAWALAGGIVLYGASFAISRFLRPPDRELVDVPAPIAARIVAAIRANQTPAGEGIMQSSPGIYQIRTADVNVTLTRPSATVDWGFKFTYARSDFLPADHATAMAASQRLSMDAYYAKYLKVTEEQVKQLRALPAAGSGGVIVDPADQTKLKALWASYVAAMRVDTEQAVVVLVREIGKKSIVASRAAAAERAAKVSAILTREQLDAFKS